MHHDVAGLVLIEPMHEEDNVRAVALTHGKVSEWESQILAFGNGCAAQAATGFQAKTELYDNCVQGLDPSLPAAVAEIDLQRRVTPGYWRARQAERIAFSADCEQLRASRKPFGALAVIVLARGVSPYLTPGRSPNEMSKGVEEANFALPSEVARSSTSGEVRVIAGADHVIQETHPAAVVTAIDDVLAKIRH